MNQNFQFHESNDFQPVDLAPMGHSKGYATASMILGIFAILFGCICCCLYYVAAVLGILALVFAFLSKRDNGGKMPGMAVAGLVCGIIGLVGFILMLILSVSTAGNAPQSEQEALDMVQKIYDKLGINIDIDEMIKQAEEQSGN